MFVSVFMSVEIIRREEMGFLKPYPVYYHIVKLLRTPKEIDNNMGCNMFFLMNLSYPLTRIRVGDC